MNLMFSWQKRYLTRSLRSLVRYRFCHSNIKFISSRHRVISSIYFFRSSTPTLLTTNGTGHGTFFYQRTFCFRWHTENKMAAARTLRLHGKWSKIGDCEQSTFQWGATAEYPATLVHLIYMGRYLLKNEG